MWKLTPAGEASALVSVGMIVIAIAVATTAVGAIFMVARRLTLRIVVVLACLLLGELALAGSGLLGRWDVVPPPFIILFVPLTVMTIRLSRSKLGDELAARLPLAFLIGVESFRLPLELVMHQAAIEHVMPPQLSYTGYNFDIVTGAAAVGLAFLTAFNLAPRALIWIWNTLGLALLATVVSLAFASTPVMHLFGPEKVNTWVAHPPFIWLPGFLVQCALLGHLLVWRKLSVTRSTARGCSSAQHFQPRSGGAAT